MAKDLNSITITGNLVNDSELKFLPSGTACCNFTIANNDVYTSGGEKKEDVSFFDCTAWGKLAEVIGQYCKKGNSVGITGRLKQERWESPDSGKRSRVKITVNDIKFLGNKKPADGTNDDYKKNVDDGDIPF